MKNPEEKEPLLKGEKVEKGEKIDIEQGKTQSESTTSKFKEVVINFAEIMA